MPSDSAPVSAVPSYRVTVVNTAVEIDCRSDQTVLQAAVAAGIDYPYACASGNCGVCISQLGGGDVVLLPRNDTSLSVAQAKAGKTLACRAQPRSDLTITWLGRGRK
jgi:CDP-4-dehydro-6-deoxyglucose reductase/ferredoxin-NAD(P)+ reductase (naphthalene dioxygenase ferredoxin-specific)